MPRKRKPSRRRRGRPVDPHARRRQTTRAGRRGEVARGSERLRAKKRTATSRDGARAMGRDVPPAAVWNAITGTLTKTQLTTLPIIGDGNARQTLVRICRRLDGCRELVLALAAERGVPEIVVRAVEHRLTPRDLVRLEALRRGLDGISAPRWWAAEAG